MCLKPAPNFNRKKTVVYKSWTNDGMEWSVNEFGQCNLFSGGLLKHTTLLYVYFFKWF